MKKKHVFFQKEKGKSLEADIMPIPDWDGFDLLIRFVKYYYNAKVLAEYDGPGSRRWILQVEETKFELIHDDGYGNYFVAPTEEDEELVYTIGKDLEDRLKDIEDE